MLVEMSVDPRGNAGCIRCGLVGDCNVDLENPREPDFELYRTVLIEKVVPHVFCVIFQRQIEIIMEQIVP